MQLRYQDAVPSGEATLFHENVAFFIAYSAFIHKVPERMV